MHIIHNLDIWTLHYLHIWFTNQFFIYILEETGKEKPTIKAFARFTGKHELGNYYESNFVVPEDFGEIGAIVIENEHHQEMYVKNIVLHGFSTGSLHITCDSWIHPKSDNPKKRVFFNDKVISLLFNYYSRVIYSLHPAERSPLFFDTIFKKL